MSDSEGSQPLSDGSGMSDKLLGDSAPSEGATEDLPMIGGQPVLPGKASVASSIFNLTNTMMGAGVLSLPFAMRSAGIAAGLTLLVFVACLSCAALVLLIKCGEATRQFTYKGVASIAFGSSFALFAEFIIILYTSGTLISYPIILGDFVSSIFRSVLPPHWFLYGILGKPAVVIVILAFTMLLPLCSLRKIDFLRFTSMVAIFNIFLTVGLVIVRMVIEYVYTGPRAISEEHGEIEFLNLGINFFLAVPLLGVSYTAHYNVFNIYAELKNRTQARMKAVIFPSMILCLGTYALASFAGYLTFRADTEDDVLNSYGKRDAAAIVGRLAMAFTIAFSYPLVCFAWRRNVCNVFLTKTRDTYPRHFIVTVAALVGSVIIAIIANKISIVLGFSGSVAGTCVVYIFPAAFYLRLRFMGLVSRNDHIVTKVFYLVMCVVLLVSGAVFGVGGFTSACKRAYQVMVLKE